MEFDEQPQEFNVDFGEVTRSGGGGGAVNSVNGKTGDVVLDAEDVGALPNSTVIPTKTSELENDGAAGDSSYVETGELASVAMTGDYGDLGNIPEFAAVATSGKYTDLTDTPTIPSTASDVGALPDSTKYGKSISASGTTLTLKDQDGEDLATTTTQDTTYSNFTGTDGQTAGASGLVPAPATTDADKFLKSDGTWDTAGGGGGGDSVYSTKTTSNANASGAVYISPLNASQQPELDPTSTDNHYKYFWALPFDASGQPNTKYIPASESINIGGMQGKDNSPSDTNNITIGYRSRVGSWGSTNTVIGWQANTGNSKSYNLVLGANAKSGDNHATAIGYNAECWGKGSVALGRGAYASSQGEVNIQADSSAYGFNNTNYRIIRGLHDGQQAHDAVTVDQINTLIDAINTAAGTNISHIGS